MEIKKLIDEIAAIERRIHQAENVISVSDKYKETSWVVCASNDSSTRANADNEFLIEAVKSARNADMARLEKLYEAVRVVEKVIDGIVAA